MIYYTSDLHFYDESMLQYEKQNDPTAPAWNSIEERDEYIIEHWNNKVTDNDEVYIAGDISLAPKNDTVRALQRLKGKKHLIIGNHDGGWLKTLTQNESVNVIDVNDGIKTIRDAGRTVVICHYPILAWEKQHKGSYLVYGHLHATYEDKLFQDAGHHFIQSACMTEFRAVNCGTMVCNYEPMTLNELCMKNNIGGTWSDNAIMQDYYEIG